MVRLVCIGPGPGPKNVLAELDNGDHVVVPYAIWKFKLSKETKLADYATAVGFVQFDVEEREAAGQTVRDVTIRTPGAEGSLIRLTVWPEFEDTPIEKGDFVAADGPFEAREYNNKTYLNLNVRTLAVIPQVERAETEVVNKKTSGKGKF